jgi:hypothetical protein
VTLAGSPPEGVSVDAEGLSVRGRRIATAGEGLWRRAPLPVDDGLFELGEPPAGAGALVTGEARDELLDKLAATGIEAAGAGELSEEGLAACAVVVTTPLEPSPLPAGAMAVLAARRVLVTGPCDPRFGLEPGLDHLHARTADEAVVYVAAVLAHWEAFAPLRAWGAIAAERYRASVFYERLLSDLAAGA